MSFRYKGSGNPAGSGKHQNIMSQVYLLKREGHLLIAHDGTAYEQRSDGWRRVKNKRGKRAA